MSDRPITIIAPAIRRVLDGTCTSLRRPRGGALSECRRGDRLWIREQFRLHRRFDGFGPLQALERGAVPVLAADAEWLPEYATSDLGRPRFARELPKAWHRAHLVIDKLRIERFSAITEDEVTREGFESWGQYLAAWDAGLRLGGRNPNWRANPVVLVFTFRCVTTPLVQTLERSTVP